jgi:beta-lactamase regulating signal transducer with metallopeptidase domain
VVELLNWIWQGCVVAAATGMILRLLHRSQAQVRYALCWVVLLMVLALPALPFLSFDSVDSSAAQSGTPAAPFIPMVSVPDAWWTSTAIVLSCWALWSGLHGIRFASALLALRRARERCRPFPLTDERGLTHWNLVRARGRQARLVLSEDVRSAGVLGCGSPVIAIAPALLRHLDLAELDLLVVHEWAHVQRRDDLLNVAQLAARAAAGWHPAVWWLDRQLQIEREAACDEIAVSVTGCVKGYAASLAKTASLLPANRSLAPAVGALSAPGLRKRIVRILSYGRLASVRWSTSAALTGALSVAGVAVGVAGLRIVGTAALASPFETRPTAVPPPADQPWTIASSGTRIAWPRSRGAKTPPANPRAGTAPADASGLGAADQTLTRVVAPFQISAAAANPADERPAPQLAARFDAPGAPIAGNVVSLGAPPSPPALMAERPATPWSAAADAGVSVGRASQKAAVATAGFFTRLGRKIAGSF